MLVLFSVSMQLARVVFDTGERAEGGEVLARLAWEIGGAVAFGVLVGVAVRLLPALHRPRRSRWCCWRCARVLSQVGTTQQLEPLLAALAAGLVIENLAVAQGDALRARGAARRAARAGRVLRGGRRVAAARCAGGDRDQPPWRSVPCGSAFIRLGLAGGARGRRRPARAGASHAWTGLVSQAGITLGFASVVAGEFPGWGSQLQLLLVALDRHQRAGRPDAVPPTGWCGPASSSATRRGRWWSCPTASRICTSTTPTGGVTVKAGHRRRRGRARRADARTRRRLDCARRRVGATGWSSTPPTRCAVPPDSAVVRAAAAVARGADVLRLLRRLRQRGPVAAVPRWSTSGRSSAPRTGPPTRTSTSGSPRPFTRELGVAAGAGLHPGLSPGAGRAGAARAPARRAHGALLAHPVAVSRSPAHLPVAARDLAGLLANDLLAFQLERDRRNFLLAAEEELGAEVELESSRVRFGGRHDHRRVRADRRRLRPHPAVAADPALPPEQRGCASCSGCAPRSSGSASIGSTTPRAFRSGSTRSMR